MEDKVSSMSYRTADPSTSRVAGLTVNSDRLELLVLTALRTCGPSTTEEIANFLRESIVSISPRMRPLERRGLIRRTMQRRRNASGKTAIVWTLESSEKDSQEFTQPVPPEKSREALKAEIEELYQTDTWAALALAHRHNIRCLMEDEKII